MTLTEKLITGVETGCVVGGGGAAGQLGRRGATARGALLVSRR